MPTGFSNLVPTGEFRFQMGLRPGDGSRFFAASADGAERLAERARLMAEAPDDYLAATDDAAPLIRQAAALVATWQPPLRLADRIHAEPALTQCHCAGLTWEPDWVVLRRDGDGRFRLVAGSVCFPSGWSVREKLGRPIDDIHEPVPGLNPALARPIHAFLTKLKAEATWQRDNWGLTADPSLNHHPSRRLRPLLSDATLDRTWLRHEDQLLARLPDSSGVLFGISVRHHPLDAVAADPASRHALALALRTMPEAVAAYKGILNARPALLDQLANDSPGAPAPAGQAGSA